MAEETQTDVLIVGAGPVGLTLALALDRCGATSTVIDRHGRISEHARARFVNARGMEIFRWLGLESEVRQVAVPHDRCSDVIWAPSLAADEVRRVEIQTLGPASGDPLSPAPGLTTSQDQLDPVLREAVGRAARCHLEPGCELTGIEQDESGVTAVCANGSGDPVRMRCRYLVGADGARSTVRELLGIPMLGPDALGHQMNITFRADLSRQLRGRPVNLAMIVNPAERGLLLNIDGERTWTTQAIYSPSAGQGPADYTDARCVQIIRTHVGDPHLNVELVRRAPWVSAARTAERYRSGRVFLAGDAAHEMPPAGGFGMNTGLADAHNLAWKLAARLHGWAGDQLLDSYDAERRPVAAWTTQETLRNLASVGRVEGQSGSTMGRTEFFRELGMVFGARYDSSAVVPGPAALPAVENPVTDYLPAALPGCRAPHAWLDAGRSTLDLFRTGFTALVAGDAAEARIAAGSVPVETAPLESQAARGIYGIGRGECVLVRPDGYVAWRGPAGEALSALDRMLCGAAGVRAT